MSANVEQYLDAYTCTKAMLNGLPRDLWDIFLPETPGGLPDLEANIISFVARAEEREAVISLQRLCGMPVRPNEALAETKAKARLRGAQKRKLMEEKKRQGDTEEEA